MSFDVEDEFIWDFWTVYDPDTAVHHLFFLYAPRTVGHPDNRHRNARVGHAVSADLTTWERLSDPLTERMAFDDLAQWTGCALRGPDAWWLFTTGLSRVDDGRVQRIGAATSRDLATFERTDLVLEADHRWYEPTHPGWPEEAWRDPFVVRGDDGLWHVYLTARDASGDSGSGVVGHAVSTDLVTWEVRPPLSDPTGRFEWLEVIQVVQVDGRWVLLFSCMSHEMPGAALGSGGVWSVPVERPGARVDVHAAVRVTDEGLYVGRVIEHDGSAWFMAFRNSSPDRGFIGGLTDPVPVVWRADGRGVALAPEDRRP